MLRTVSPSGVPSRPEEARALVPIQSHINHYVRVHRVEVRTALFARHSMAPSVREDLFAALAFAAEARRVVAALLKYRAAGVEYLCGERWFATEKAIVRVGQSSLSLQVVVTGPDVRVCDEFGNGVYPMVVGGVPVGWLWRNAVGEWTATRLVDGARVDGGSYQWAEAAAYDVGWLIADH